MLLENKVAVIYGAGGAVGSAVAKGFACEGAGLFLVGRNLASVQQIAAGVDGAEAAEVDVLDQVAIERHMDQVIARAGQVKPVPWSQRCVTTLLPLGHWRQVDSAEIVARELLSL